MGKLSKIIFIVCFLSGIIIGQDEFKRVGKSGFGFLKISPSARAAGMGDAFTAIANDVTTIFYNPAGLVNTENYSITAGITNLYGLNFLEHQFFAVSLKKNFALSFQSLGHLEPDDCKPHNQDNYLSLILIQIQFQTVQQTLN